MRPSQSSPVSNEIRYRLDPRLVPPHKAARYLHLTLRQFEDALPSLISRGFPRPCPVIGYFDLTAINEWLDRQSGVEGQKDDADIPDLERAVLERFQQYDVIRPARPTDSRRREH